MPEEKKPSKGPEATPRPMDLDEMGRLTPDLLVRVIGLARVTEVEATLNRVPELGAGGLPTRGSMTLIVAALKDAELRSLARTMGLSDTGENSDVFRRLIPFI